MIHAGDCLEVLRSLDAGSVDAVITDPPYGIGFMGHEWDQPGVQMPPQREGLPQGERRRSQPAPSGFDLGSDAIVAGRCDHSRSAMQAFQGWCEAWSRECLRVLKPGGYIVTFGGARTSHRLACAIEDAGFEIRDSIVWLFAQGFPKSLDVGKAIDKAAGAEREVVGHRSPFPADHPRPNKDFGKMAAAVARGNANASALGFGREDLTSEGVPVTVPATPDAERWDGWGTALKPAHEPVVVARKPLTGTVVANVLEHGTGAINVDAGRLDWNGDDKSAARKAAGYTEAAKKALGVVVAAENTTGFSGEVNGTDSSLGRWPANVALSHSEGCERVGTRRVKAITGTASGRMGEGYQSSVYGGYTGNSELFGKPTGYGDEDGMEVVDEWDCVEGCPVRALDEQSGLLESGTGAVKRASAAGYESGSMAGRESRPEGTPNVEYGDAGGASRFFFCAKASRGERNAGLDAFEKRPILWSSGEQNPGSFQADGTDRSARNPHPTVKPIDLMRWLVRMFVQPGGTVLDPFAGSGTTGCAAALEGMEFVGIEREPAYARIAEARIAYWSRMPVGMDTKRVLRAELANREHDGQLTLL